MEVKIKYKESVLVVQGMYHEEDSETNFREQFEIDEIKRGDLDVFDDYDLDDLDEIETLCLNQRVIDIQDDWEIAKV